MFTCDRLECKRCVFNIKCSNCHNSYNCDESEFEICDVVECNGEKYLRCDKKCYNCEMSEICANSKEV